ncbi:MAG TPA: hypothetical protein VG839_07870 [Asticcacaulis sp.]|nr:hypothetical protein [Asticcacaulis sp.]
MAEFEQADISTRILRNILVGACISGFSLTGMYYLAQPIHETWRPLISGALALLALGAGVYVSLRLIKDQVTQALALILYLCVVIAIGSTVCGIVSKIRKAHLFDYSAETTALHPGTASDDLQ